MSVIWIIARNTYREIIRDRILYGLLVFAVLLIGISLAMGQLSFAEQARISANFGLSAIHLGSVILTIFIGSTLLTREIEKKTILTILVHPVSRLQFIVGKCLGLSLLLLTNVAILSCVLVLIFLGLQMPLDQNLLIAIFGILLEALVLLGFTLFFSMFATPSMAVSFVIGIFLIGHWTSSLEFFAAKSDNPSLLLAYHFTHWLLPNLDNFNWKPLVVYPGPTPWAAVGLASLYALAWFIGLLIATAMLFKRKDLG